MNASSEHTPNRQRPPRNVFLQRPSPFSFLAVPFLFYWRNWLSILQHTLVIGLIFLVAVVVQMTLIPRDADWVGLCLVTVMLSGAWWYFHLYRPWQRLDRERLDTIKKARGALRGMRFDDGSVDDFIPAGVLRTIDNVIIAIDPQRALIRAISTRRGIDRIFELPANADLDVGLYARPGKPHKQVVSLIYAEEQEDGFKVTAWSLASESIDDATRLVAALRARRS